MKKIDPDRLTNAKKAAGEEAIKLVQNGMLIGLGTGTTTTFFIEALAKRCQEGLNIKAVCSSQRSLDHANSLGIPLLDPRHLTSLDLTVDGADEIDHRKNMIKGGGGALLRERLLASSSKEFVVIVDETKLVDHLGTFPVPVEISAFVYQTTLNRLKEKGYVATLRLDKNKNIYLTDNGNYIVDIQFPQPILNPKKENRSLRLIPGVLDTGLFFHLTKQVIVGYLDGFVKIQT